MLSRLHNVTNQLDDTQAERDELSTRLDHLQKVFHDVEQGIVTDTSPVLVTYWWLGGVVV